MSLPGYRIIVIRPVNGDFHNGYEKVCVASLSDFNTVCARLKKLSEAGTPAYFEFKGLITDGVLFSERSAYVVTYLYKGRWANEVFDDLTSARDFNLFHQPGHIFRYNVDHLGNFSDCTIVTQFFF